MKVFIRRDGIHWMRHHYEGKTLVFTHDRFPRYPATYGRLIALTPAAMAPDPVKLMHEAMSRLFRNLVATDRWLRMNHKRGIDYDTVSYSYVAGEPAGEGELLLSDGEPGTDRRNTVIGWKANSL